MSLLSADFNQLLTGAPYENYHANDSYLNFIVLHRQSQPQPNSNNNKNLEAALGCIGFVSCNLFRNLLWFLNSGYTIGSILLHSFENFRLLCLEFLFGQNARSSQVRELLNKVGGVGCGVSSIPCRYVFDTSPHYHRSSNAIE